MLVLLVLGFLSGCNSGYWKEETKKECVKSKWVKSVSNSEQKYLVGMKSGEVYQITDSFFKLRFDSSNLYNEIEEGQCYEINHFGWRIPFFSVYKVIYKIKPTT